MIYIIIPTIIWTTWFIIVLYNYCIKEHKSIKDGFCDWYHESDNDI